MHEPVQKPKLLIALIFKNLPQVKLHVGLPADEGAIAQQADGEAIRQQAPEVLGAVELFLEGGVGGEADVAFGR